MGPEKKSYEDLSNPKMCTGVKRNKWFEKKDLFRALFFVVKEVKTSLFLYSAIYFHEV